MVKGGALYMVIVIALVIGIICSSLIAAAYYYKINYLKKNRYDELSRNLSSGVAILLATPDTAYGKGNSFSLYGTNRDSVCLQKKIWGLYTVGTVRSFSQGDTLFKTLTIANTIDSSKWGSVYLADNERPFALAGKTQIRGNVFIPKAGVQQVYVNGLAYTGDKRLIIGAKHNSEKFVPSLDTGRLMLAILPSLRMVNGNTPLLRPDSLTVSFRGTPKLVNFGKSPENLKSCYYSGNIILYSDTILTIDSTAKLNHVLVFAKAIVVGNGFRGNAQLFARDSINIGVRSVFTYPSCLAVVRSGDQNSGSGEKIMLANDVTVNGVVLTYEKRDNPAKPIVILGKKARVNGQVYTQGGIELKDDIEVAGSAFTMFFYYRNAFSFFQNYIVNGTIDSKALSPYYLSSDVLPVSGKKKKVLEWLESN